MIAVNDIVASFKVLRVAPSTSDASVDALVGREFPLDAERLGAKWTEVDRTSGYRTIYATAWDRSLVRNVIAAAKAAGLDPVVMDLKSACIARTVAVPSCVVLDVAPERVDIVLIDEHVPQVWQSFELNVPVGEDIAPALAGPLRTVLRFYERQSFGQFGPASPILLSGDQVPSSQVMSSLASVLGHPVEAVPSPPRVPDIRYGTYLTCIGLLMRRG
jgi:Tfp pilus assembly PilM family ATPase